MQTLRDLSESKLHAEEQQTVREAADAMVFCTDLGDDPAAEKALADLYALTDVLVESDRLPSEVTIQLIADVEACGPLAPVA